MRLRKTRFALQLLSVQHYEEGEQFAYQLLSVQDFGEAASI